MKEEEEEEGGKRKEEEDNKKSQTPCQIKKETNRKQTKEKRREEKKKKRETQNTITSKSFDVHVEKSIVCCASAPGAVNKTSGEKYPTIGCANNCSLAVVSKE